ncbi:HD domain-containing protein [Actinoallomurus spadix]|uniref:HD/PDEase domain-containing protein n=1 Tax=Actinoallomurus spadix TaxID=79912 RepID=A0ABN0XQM2_9ACTN|nr:HD domain-containing protein [Actinoallomurus spadix]MCO5988306.1 HD domain-containing protein [Actinoallomurus spadix]
METFTNWRTWEQARAALAAHPVDVAALDRAAEAALRWHGEQRRPTGAPYAEHLFEALEVLVRGAGVTDTDVLVTALLHDTVEDTGATLADVEAAFGPEVGELVDWVTKPPVEGKAAKRAAKVSYLRRLRDAPREAILVKLADRVSNVQTLDRMPPDFQRRYHAETVTYIVPLAATEPWFAGWFAAWQERFAHLR